MNDGTGRGKGRSQQEGQPEEGPGQEGSVTPFFDALMEEMPAMSDDPDQGKFRQQGWGQDLPSNQPYVECTICNGPHNPAAHHTLTPLGTRVDTSQFGPKRSRGDAEGRDRGARHWNAQGAAQRPQSGLPFDPVLRKALIDKGIITVEDLDRASHEIQAFTQAVTGGYNAGTGTSTVRSDVAGPGVRSAE